jgi:hypothetical protein
MVMQSIFIGGRETEWEMALTFPGGSRDNGQHRAYRAGYGCRKDTRTHVPERGYKKIFHLPGCSAVFLGDRVPLHLNGYREMVNRIPPVCSWRVSGVVPSGTAGGEDPGGHFQYGILRNLLFLKPENSDMSFSSSDFGLHGSRIEKP